MKEFANIQKGGPRMNEEKNPKKPLIYYYGVAIIIVMLLNALVFPYILKKHITQVDYGTFLNMIEKNQIEVVEIQENQIAFIAKDSQGKESVYITGLMDDPDLVNRLHNAKINFSKVI